MTAALDFGTDEFRSLRREDQQLIARRLPAVYTVVDDTPANRKALEQTLYPYAIADQSLIVIGDAAVKVSTLMSRPLIPLFNRGKIAEQDAISRQVCAWLIELLLPANPGAPKHCSISLPKMNPTDNTQSAQDWSGKFLEHVVQLQGYQTEVLSQGTALSLAEMNQNEFTGIALVIGADSVQFELMRQSKPVLNVRYPKGTQHLVEQFAHAHKKYLWDHEGNSYLDLASVMNWMQTGDISLSAPQLNQEVWLRDAYAELLISTFIAAKHKLHFCNDPILKRPLQMVVSGGSMQLHGLLDLTGEVLKMCDLPVQIHTVRTASFEPYSVARGLLIQATLNAGEKVDHTLAVEAA
ncbi:hypothetical protein SH668x_001602 [Planctomicrobium sp. SH668]|uniref:hypothetical protein n=1 Tax=Planctomicrobium sp. SH668 TaxID=3448126 RepID=UPI003F5B2D8E